MLNGRHISGSWEPEEMFSFDPMSRAILSMFKPTDFPDKEVMSLTDDTFMRKTLEHPPGH